jgi:parvulin-like peptidyl-prolyl isomerase
VAGTPQPTPTPDTEEAFQTRYDEFVTKVLKPARVSESGFRSIVEAEVLREKLQEALVPTVPTEEDQVRFRYTVAQDADEARAKIAAYQAGVEEQVQAQHILVETEEEARQVLQRLQNGEDFGALAAELSQDSSNKDDGGNLGWFGRGTMVPEFDQAAFGAEPGLIPNPVKTDFGYHIINILGHEERPINLEEELIDAGWQGKEQLSAQYGPLFAEMLFASPIGAITEPVPMQYGVAVVELLEREVRALDEAQRQSRRAETFASRLQEIQEEADIDDRWDTSMVPTRM